jgi:hypothetical protein
MTERQRLFSIVVGVVGAAVSSLALLGFLLKIRRNGLELPDFPTSQAVYATVGEAYSGGFIAGFSLCFFLTLLAVAVGTWLENRRARRLVSPPSRG